MLDDILTPWRVKWYSRGALFALAVAFVAILLSGSGTTSLTGRIGGDYPAFYAAGQIIADGKADSLYSPSLQRDYQKPLLGDESGFLPFVYPPQFAIAYVPLSQLPYRLSYAVHTLLMVAALALACLLIRRIYPRLVEKPELLFFLALTAYPILRSIMGAQNTALSLLLIVLIWYKVLHNKHYQAGIFLGLLFFKPQFALPLTGLFLLSGRWRVWVSAGATVAVLYAASTAVIGVAWVGDWLDLATTFSRLDAQVNFGELVSWQGFTRALMGAGSGLAGGLGWGLSAATVVGISWIWFRGGRKADFSSQLALASICIVLISPHTLYYDTGIALIAVVVVLNRMDPVSPSLILGVWAMGLLQLLSPAAGVSLVFAPMVLILIVAIAYLWPSSVKSTEAQAA